MADLSPRPCRVLALVLHPGCSGHVTLDGFGIVRHSFRMSRVGRRGGRAIARALRLFLQRLVRRYRPTHAVLGISRNDDRAARGLRHRAHRILKALGIPTALRAVHWGAGLLVHGGRGDRPNTLARRLVQGFFPDLAAHLERSDQDDWYHRSAWHATALALATLVEEAPFAAAALARADGFPMGRFHAALLTALHARTPTL